MVYPSWNEWLETLPEPERQSALGLRDRFAELGAGDPQSWARSEVSEGIAQLARFLFLRDFWHGTIDRWRRPFELETTSPGRRLLEAGARREDLEQLARLVAFEAVHDAMNRVDGGGDRNAGDDLPGWELIEVGPGGRPTGRIIGGLHESILEFDPDRGETLWT